MTVSRTVSTGTSSGTLKAGSSTGISEHSQCSGRERGGGKPGQTRDSIRNSRKQNGNYGYCPWFPMRVTKEQVIGALKLMGLEFQDAELEMMMRGVNQALAGYEGLRKPDVPIDA